MMNKDVLLEVFLRNALYKSTFYLLTYLFIYSVRTLKSQICHTVMLQHVGLSDLFINNT